MSQAYIHGILINLRTAIRWAYERELIEKLPKMKVPSANYRMFKPPTPEEARKIFEVAPPHMKRVIVLGLMLGLRVGQSELLCLKWDHVDLDQNLVVIDTSRKNPNQPWREVPIPESVIPLFHEWYEEDKDAKIKYVVHFNGKKINSIKTAWKTILKNAEIDRRIRPYDLRHAFATQLIAGGIDYGTVARLMGHSSPQMVLMHYQHVSTIQKRKAVDALPDITCVPNLCAKK